MKRVSSFLMASLIALTFSACGGQASPSSSQAASPAESAQEPSKTDGTMTTIQIASEYSASEPIGMGLEKWKELVAQNGDGSIKLKIYPDSQLGAKNDIIDSMLLGENVITGGDPAFLAEYGAKDLGILFGPFLFSSNDECAALTSSDWFQEQCKLLESKGLKVVNATWVTGTRHILTNKPVQKVEDLKGMKIRVPSNQIQTESFNVMGAAATGMALGDVYAALQSGTIDGAENPLSTLYGRKLHEVSKNLILDGHVRVISMWVMSADVYNALTPEQQELITSTALEAGEYYNELQTSTDSEYLEMMKAEGVTVVEAAPEIVEGFVEASKPFYEMGDKFGWSDGLYDTVRNAMKK